MGISSDAQLHYGIALPEGEMWWDLPDGEEFYEDEDHTDEDGDLSDLGSYLAAWIGIPDPSLQIPEELRNGYDYGAYKTWLKEHPEVEAAQDAYYARKRELEKEAPVEIEMHCSYDYPMYIVSLRGTEVRSYRGNVEELDFNELTSRVTDEKVKHAKEFCENFKIGRGFKNPSWIMTSMYG